MITITETATRIGCSRTKIYAALKRLDIKPHKQKRKSLLDDEQIALVQESLPGDSTNSSELASENKQPEPPNQRIAPTYDPQPLLVGQLQAEVGHLKTLLEREQAERTNERIERADERKAERERAERHDVLVTALLSEQKGLRDEVQRLKAIQGPEQVFSAFNDSPGEDEKSVSAATSTPSSTSNVVHLERTSESPFEQAAPVESAEAAPRPDTPVDFTEKSIPQPEAVIGNNGWGSRLTAFGLIGATMVVIAFLVTINNPDLILSKAIASLWQ